MDETRTQSSRRPYLDLVAPEDGVKLGLESTYARALPGASMAWRPATVPAPRLLFWNDDLADGLGKDWNTLDEARRTAIFSGNEVPDDAEPVAQGYAGHQFGNFSRQLGDGRALLLGEVVDARGARRDIAFKGSGPTPYSRGGDGKAAVGPMLREVVVGEAMHALGIPTTRALAVVSTGEEIHRETALPGAILTRVAASHIRVGTFEFFASRGDVERLRALAEYAIARHDPDLAGRPDRFTEFPRAVARRQASLVASWMHVGFIHGVMNTDNVAVSGETIDFGPCAFLEDYSPRTVFSSIDAAGRYAYGNQPRIAHWNLARLCEAFLALLSDDQAEAIAIATGIVEEFPGLIAERLLAGWRAKLGIRAPEGPDDQSDAELVDAWLDLLHAGKVDFTNANRALGDAAFGEDAALRALFPDTNGLDSWLSNWRARLERDDAGRDPASAAAERAARMDAVNPLYIARNHLVEEALAAASDFGDLAPLHALLEVVRHPFAPLPGRERYAEPAPREVTACYQTFCGT